MPAPSVSSAVCVKCVFLVFFVVVSLSLSLTLICASKQALADLCFRCCWCSSALHMSSRSQQEDKKTKIVLPNEAVCSVQCIASPRKVYVVVWQMRRYNKKKKKKQQRANAIGKNQFKCLLHAYYFICNNKEQSIEKSRERRISITKTLGVGREIKREDNRAKKKRMKNKIDFIWLGGGCCCCCCSGYLFNIMQLLRFAINWYDRSAVISTSLEIFTYSSIRHTHTHGIHTYTFAHSFYFKRFFFPFISSPL